MCYGDLIRLVRQCSSLHTGRSIHKQVGDKSNVYLSNLLVQMYGRCGSPEESHHVFEETLGRNAFSWSLLTAAYAQNGYVNEAAIVFDKSPRKDVICWNLMLSAYAQAGFTERAKNSFENAPQRNVISWNSLASAFVQNGDFLQALTTLRRMAMHDVISYNTNLLSIQDEGEDSCLDSLFSLLQERNFISWSIMVQSFARRDDIEKAEQVFLRMPQRGLVACNAMVAGYARASQVHLSKQVFDNMQEHDVASWTSLMESYAQCGMIECAKQVFFEQMPTRSVVSWTALLACFSRAGLLEDSRSTFQRMPQRNIISWNNMIATSASDASSSSWSLFCSSPQKDSTSWNSVLASLTSSACSNLAKADLLFDRMPQHGLVSCNSMLSLYAGLGLSVNAGDFVRRRMPVNDIVTWSTIVSSLVNSGDVSGAFQLFREMNLEGDVQPDEACFTSLLTGFKDRGMLLECRLVFTSMSGDYGVETVPDHFDCMVDALGRCGELELASELLQVMPFEPGDVSRMALDTLQVIWTNVILSRGATKVVLYHLKSGGGLDRKNENFNQYFGTCTGDALRAVAMREMIQIRTKAGD